jgi:biotin synthase-related radical SAM superfamily protein
VHYRGHSGRPLKVPIPKVELEEVLQAITEACEHGVAFYDLKHLAKFGPVKGMMEEYHIENIEYMLRQLRSVEPKLSKCLKVTTKKLLTEELMKYRKHQAQFLKVTFNRCVDKAAVD